MPSGPAIPSACRALWDELLAEELMPVFELYNEVMRYRALIAERAGENPEIDGSFADGLAEATLALLRTVDDDAPTEHRRLVQASARYFIVEDDGDGDLASPLGFDDDAEVFNAVAVHLGHPELCVELP